MFRGNRIGTPHINTTVFTSSTAAITPNNGAIVQPLRGNVINPTPLADFGQTSVKWTGAFTMPLNEGAALLQQFAISLPPNGDTVGVEIGGSIIIRATNNPLLVPVATKLQAASGTLFGAVTANTDAESTLEPTIHRSGDIHHCQYQTQIIFNKGAFLAGTYAHGIKIQASTASVVSDFTIECYVRQLNDQQTINYRDTRR